MPENKSSRNKTLYFDNISDEEKTILDSKVIKYNSYNINNFLVDAMLDPYAFCNKTINADSMQLMPKFKAESFDLIILDPPYNLSKKFSADSSFKQTSTLEYKQYIRNILVETNRILKKTGTLYLCNSWQGMCLQEVLEEFFILRNCITFFRDKGRGSKRNFKNNSEIIFYCTKSNDYTFNYEDIKIKKKVIAPYRDQEGKAKDWKQEDDGNYRDSYLGNFWKDTVTPFWSMSGGDEHGYNTSHPTQKPQPVVDRLVRASSNIGDIVLDPYLGSGTTSVVCKKLGRNYVGIEIDNQFCILSEQRLSLT